MRGQSGNPKGRAKGSRNRRAKLFEQLLSDGGEALISKAVEMARGGDRLMLKLILEKLLPRPRGPAVEVELPRVERAADVVAAVAAVIEHASHGDLSLGEARAFLDLIEVQRKAVETADLAARLEALESEEVDR